MLAVDLDRRKAGRQRAARHDVAHVEPLLGGVEVGEVAGTYVDGGDRKAQLAGIEALEVDETLERFLERRRIVIADRGERAARLQRRRWQARREEAGHAEEERLRCRKAIEPAVGVRIGSPHRLRDGGADELPELPQARDALVRRVAGDQRAVDAADGDAGDPARGDAFVGERLEHARLVGTERAAALQHEHVLVAISAVHGVTSVIEDEDAGKRDACQPEITPAIHGLHRTRRVHCAVFSRSPNLAGRRHRVMSARATSVTFVISGIVSMPHFRGRIGIPYKCVRIKRFHRRSGP